MMFQTIFIKGGVPALAATPAPRATKEMINSTIRMIFLDLISIPPCFFNLRICSRGDICGMTLTPDSSPNAGRGEPTNRPWPQLIDREYSKFE
jgi:hypothetical protein